jgi:hypothetical protein
MPKVPYFPNLPTFIFRAYGSNCIQPWTSPFNFGSQLMTKTFPSGILQAKKNAYTRTVALAAIVTLLGQNFAWAVCSNGQQLPAGGFVVGRDAVVSTAANWSPNVFTGTAGSIFVPDLSVNEQNSAAAPLTNGGHNWVFDQGSTLCKETDVGTANGPTTGWSIPPNTATDCVVLPIIKGGRVTNLGDIPYQGQTVTPTCTTALLGTSNNTYFNQLGCTIAASRTIGSTPVDTDARTATTFLFVAGIKGGLFSIPLDNVANPIAGSTAGKTVGPQNYYSDIPEGQKLTNAAVSPDGMFAMATSIRRAQFVYACLNPLGDPGDPSQPITQATVSAWANSAITSQVKCMQSGNNNLSVDLTTAFGPDNQPYFGGQRIVNSYNNRPGGSVTTAWPQCLFNGAGLGAATTFAQLMNNLKVVFNNHSANHCGNAQPNFGFSSALVTQPQALIPHVAANGDLYMYTGPLGGTVVQFKVTKDINGVSQYAFRTYLTGVSLTTGLGVADDLTFPNNVGATGGSLMIFTDPSAVGLAGQEVVTRLPLCEDM